MSEKSTLERQQRKEARASKRKKRAMRQNTAPEFRGLDPAIERMFNKNLDTQGGKKKAPEMNPLDWIQANGPIGDTKADGTKASRYEIVQANQRALNDKIRLNPAQIQENVNARKREMAPGLDAAGDPKGQLIRGDENFKVAFGLDGQPVGFNDPTGRMGTPAVNDMERSKINQNGEFTAAERANIGSYIKNSPEQLYKGSYSAEGSGNVPGPLDEPSSGNFFDTLSKPSPAAVAPVQPATPVQLSQVGGALPRPQTPVQSVNNAATNAANTMLGSDLANPEKLAPRAQNNLAQSEIGKLLASAAGAVPPEGQSQFPFPSLAPDFVNDWWTPKSTYPRPLPNGRISENEIAANVANSIGDGLNVVGQKVGKVLMPSWNQAKANFVQSDLGKFFQNF